MSRVLLLGATTPLGRQILLKLALAGHEVTAHIAAGVPVGDLADFASQVAQGTPDDVIRTAGCEAVVASAPLDDAAFDAVRRTIASACREGSAGLIRDWVQFAPFIRHTEWRDARQRVALEELGVRVSLVRHAPCFADVVAAFEPRCVVGRWGLDVVNPIHEGEVAALALRAIGEGHLDVSVGGPEALTWQAVARAVARARGRRAWIIPWPTWAVRPAEPHLAPVVGARTLHDYVHPLSRQRVDYARQAPPRPSVRTRSIAELRRGPFSSGVEA